MKDPGQHLLVISPHLDDAVLSVGALIVGFDEVTVLTVFTGGPQGALSPAAVEDRSRYGGRDPLPIRLDEDRTAGDVLGFDRVLADVPELIFRRRADGTPRCSSLDDIFGGVTADDAGVVTQVAAFIEEWVERLQPDVVMGPLSIGNHADHAIVRQAVDMQLLPITYYRDMPYVVRGMDLPDPGLSVRRPWTEYEHDVDAWIEGIECYASQVPILFEGTDWRRTLRTWAASDEAFVLDTVEPTDFGGAD